MRFPRQNRTADHTSTRGRLAWFAGIWAASVLALGIAAWAIRAVLR